jgi:hypothetical protein
MNDSNDLYNAMIAAADRVIAAAHIAEVELTTAFVLVVSKPYSDPATETGRGYIRACTAAMIGARRLTWSHPAMIDLYDCVWAFEKAADDE